MKVKCELCGVEKSPQAMRSEVAEVDGEKVRKYVCRKKATIDFKGKPIEVCQTVATRIEVGVVDITAYVDMSLAKDET